MMVQITSAIIGDVIRELVIKETNEDKALWDIITWSINGICVILLYYSVMKK